MSASIQVSGLGHYSHKYESKRRFASYWHQLDECLAVGGTSVLVVGKGSGLPSILLQRQGFKVITVDIDPALEPTVFADVRHLPFSNEAFDIVVCCQVLEHLPWQFFLPALYELKRMVRRGLVLSLPDRGRYSKFMPYLLFRRREVMDIPNVWYKSWTFNGEHYWEVNTKGHRLKDIEDKIKEAGFNIKHTFRVWENPYHRFWHLNIT